MTNQSMKRPMIAFVGLPIGGEESESHLLIRLGYGNIQRTLREYSENTQRTLREHSENIHVS